MLISKEIEQTMKRIEENVLYFCKLKCYNKGKIEIDFCGSELSITYQAAKEKIK